MTAVGATLVFLLGSAIVLALCSLWVVALLDIQSQVRRGAYSHKTLVSIAIAISVLAVCLIATAHTFYVIGSSEPRSPWSDWGIRLGG
jgi:amino acid transporter